MEIFNSYTIIVIDPDSNRVEQESEWEVTEATTNEALYRIAARKAALIVAAMGTGAAIVHIELTHA